VRVVAVQALCRPVDRKGAQYESEFLSGSSIKSFTPHTADMSLNPKNRQDGNNDREFRF